MGNEKTADGVDYVSSMTLWGIDGSEITPDNRTESIEFGRTWIEWDKPYEAGDGYLAGSTWVGGVIETFFSSLDAVCNFKNSPQNQCFSCGVTCRPLGSGRGTIDQIPAFCGLVFRSGGNFGSTVFDPYGPAKLQIHICDECAMRNQDRITFLPSDGSSVRPWSLNDE